MKIYTKTGDQGTTTDLLGNRLSKADLKMELQGALDEINAGIGHLRSLMMNTEFIHRGFHMDHALREIQYILFRIGGDVSADFSSSYVKDIDLILLEENIDIMTSDVGQLDSFIYYSGDPTASYCQVVRSITRRAERVFVKFLEGKSYNLDYQYINRLSDFLFTLARYMNYASGTPEEAMILK